MLNTHLANDLFTDKHTDLFLSSPDVKNALNNIREFVVVPTDKATGNIALVCKRFYASVIAKDLGIYNNSSALTYK